MKTNPSPAYPARPTRCFSTNTLTAFTLAEFMFVILIIGILLGIAIPNFIVAREQARTKSCVSNLKKIEWAKMSWLMDKNALPTHVFVANDLYPADGSGYFRTAPQCPATGNYTIGNGNQDPACDYGGGTLHVINK